MVRMLRMPLIWLSRPNATRRIACPDPRHRLDILPAVWPAATTRGRPNTPASSCADHLNARKAQLVGQFLTRLRTTEMAGLHSRMGRTVHGIVRAVRRSGSATPAKAH